MYQRIFVVAETWIGRDGYVVDVLSTERTYNKRGVVLYKEVRMFICRLNVKRSWWVCCLRGMNSVRSQFNHFPSKPGLYYVNEEDIRFMFRW